MAGLILTMLGGCGWFDSKKTVNRVPAELAEFKASLGVRTLWQAQVGSSGRFALQPAWSGDTVVAASADGTVSAYQLSTGQLRWRVMVEFRISAGVGLGGNSTVVVAGGEGDIVALALNDGSQLWKAKINAEPFGAPIFIKNVVVVRSSDARLFGFDAEKGSRLWALQRTLPSLVMRTEALMASSDDTLFTGMPGGRIMAVAAANGNVKFDSAIALPRGATELERMVDVIGAVVFNGGEVCGAAHQGRVACINAQTGSVNWSREFSAGAGLGGDIRYVFGVDTRSHIQAFSRTGGGVVWKNERLEYRSLSTPVSWGRAVIVGDFQGQIHFLAREDGAMLARVSTDGGAIRAAPVAVEQAGINAVVVQTVNGGLFVLGQSI
jgi:outer membrane protein assembly factor BamB